MYSPSPATVNVGAWAGLSLVVTAGLAFGLAFGRPTNSTAALQTRLTAAQAAIHPSDYPCDPAFAALFAPPHPRSGRYEVCPTDQPLSALIEPGWQIEPTAPLDAFGLAGTYNRSALIRLYGGRRAMTARGWHQADGAFESLTLISPYPDPALRRLIPGTLIIRFILCCT